MSWHSFANIELCHYPTINAAVFLQKLLFPINIFSSYEVEGGQTGYCPDMSLLLQNLYQIHMIVTRLHLHMRAQSLQLKAKRNAQSSFFILSSQLVWVQASYISLYLLPRLKWTYLICMEVGKGVQFSTVYGKSANSMHCILRSALELHGCMDVLYIRNRMLGSGFWILITSSLVTEHKHLWSVCYSKNFVSSV